jgi:hypothetical protein
MLGTESGKPPISAGGAMYELRPSATQRTLVITRGKEEPKEQVIIVDGHLVDDPVVHGAELVQDAGHRPLRSLIVKILVQKVISLLFATTYL